jgi:hypothetical protein
MTDLAVSQAGRRRYVAVAVGIVLVALVAVAAVATMTSPLTRQRASDTEPARLRQMR